MENRCSIDKNRQGFTLIEASVVMIIVGLMLGGVVVGQDLIRSATVRAALSEIEEYQVAVNTFTQKYESLPGDINFDEASAFGFAARSGEVGHGDGNGLIEGCGSGETVAGCETVLFWADMSLAGLISGDFVAEDDVVYMAALMKMQEMLQALSPIQNAYAGKSNLGVGDAGDIGGIGAEPGDGKEIIPAPVPVPVPDYTRSMRDSLFPRTSVGDENSMLVFSDRRHNYFQIAGVQSTNEDGEYNLSNGMTPLEAYALDVKYDDGLPQTGEVQAMSGTGPLNVAAIPGPSSCVSDAAANPYNTANLAVANDKVCQLRIEMRAF